VPDYKGQQFGSYNLTRLLGEGGFADVYLGSHVHLGTEAAVKVLTAKLTQAEIASFQNEARILRQLQHPNIVRVLDFGVKGSIPFIVMDYAPHGSLRDLHPDGSRIPSKTAIAYAKQVSAALQYAHDQGLVHRDIKPENMLVGRNREVLLSDFGIVAPSSSLTLQQKQGVAGTIYYMAPEQIQGHPVRASDQYAMGIVIYEWLCGAPPFQGTWNEIASQHVQTAPPPLRGRASSISSELERAVLKALSKDPQQRFATIQAFAEALEPSEDFRRQQIIDKTRALGAWDIIPYHGHIIGVQRGKGLLGQQIVWYDGENPTRCATSF
jgi:serine/threonine protein kinase